MLATDERVWENLLILFRVMHTFLDWCWVLATDERVREIMGAIVGWWGFFAYHWLGTYWEGCEVY
jgi:hypothetical protein